MPQTNIAAVVNYPEGSGSAGPAHNYTLTRRDDAGTVLGAGQFKQPNLVSADPLATTWSDGGTTRSRHIDTLTITTTQQQFVELVTTNQGYTLMNTGATNILVGTVNRAFSDTDRDVFIIPPQTAISVPGHEDPTAWWFRTASGTSTLKVVNAAFTRFSIA